jgi:hypothetical protein
VTQRPQLLAALLLVGLVVLAGGGGTAAAGKESLAAAMPSQMGVAICPNVTETTYPGPDEGPSVDAACGPFVFSAGFVDGACIPHGGNADLGAFLPSKNPLGVSVHVSAPNDCSTSPPTLGAGAGYGAVTASVAQTGFCPTTLTIPTQLGRYGAVRFPIGSLTLGSYSVTVTFPDQTVSAPQGPQPKSWSGSRASGTLRVGAPFTETDTITLTGAGKREIFAVLLTHSVAGQGAGRLVSSKTGRSAAKLSGTDYYACGTINVAAEITYGKRGAKGIRRVSGSGTLNGGTGNYKGLTGGFTVRGRYSTKTSRGTLVLKGTATYE